MRTFKLCFAVMLLIAVSVSPAAGASPFRRIITKLKTEAIDSLSGKLRAAASASCYSAVISPDMSWSIVDERPLFAERPALASPVGVPSTEFRADLYRILTVENASAEDALLQKLRSAPDVEYAEPDYPIDLFEYPNDVHFSKQWGLRNVGQSYLGVERVDGENNDVLTSKSGKSGADIHVSSSWQSVSTRVRPLVVIIDTGLDTGHVDIHSNLWMNPGEVTDNAVDDDHNGFLDDSRGWDFSGDGSLIGRVIVGDNDVSDYMGHGTHCAGIIGAVANNGIGIAGVCDSVRIASLKIFPNALMSVASQAIVYAADIGADVISMSWGSPYRSSLLLEALRYARSRGVFLVAASGNFASDLLLYPASFSEVMTVGASNSDDEVTYFSSFGDWIDVIAPGLDILSLRAEGTDLYAQNGEPDVRIIDNVYYLADGTSMAAPHAAGVAAMVLSYSPGLQPDSLQRIITGSADDIVRPYGDAGEVMVGWDRYSGHGRVNVQAAVSMLKGDLAKFTTPYSGQVVKSDIDITGFAYSEGEPSYSLDIAHAPDTSEWVNINSGAATVRGGFIGRLLISGRVGDYTLRLTLGGSVTVYRQITIVSSRKFEVTSPQQGDSVLLYTTVRGSAADPKFESYEVFLRTAIEGSVWDTLFASTRMVVDSVLCDLHLGRYRSGAYVLRVKLNTSDEQLIRDINFSMNDMLRSGFPQPGALASNMHFSANVSDLNRDGLKEVVVTTYDGVSVLSQDGTPFSPGWPRELGIDCYSAPAVWDVDGDGLQEIAVCSELGLHLYDCYGAAVDSFPKFRPTGWMYTCYPTPLITDLDEDGASEILWTGSDGCVYAYRSNGRSYFASLDGYFSTTGAGYAFADIVPFLFCVDLEGDGEKEVIGSFASSRHGGAVYVWQAKNGQPRSGRSSALIGQFGKLRGGCIADFNLDGEYDIGVVGRTNYDTVFAAIMDGYGNFLPGWPKKFKDRINYLVNYPAAGDIDGDGYPDLVFTISSMTDGEIYVFRYDGTPYRPNLSEDGSFFAGASGAFGCAVLGDVDGNGITDIVVRAGSFFPSVEYERIFAFDRDAQVLHGWPVYTLASPGQVSSTIHTPLLTDIDSDGLLDMVVTSDDRQVYVWRIGTPYDSNRIPWGKFLHDSRNSGVLPIPTTTPAAEIESEIVPTTFSLSQNYPNPFNSGTSIDFKSDHSTQVEIDVFNLLGQRVRTLIAGRMERGSHTIYWDGRDAQNAEVASGIYFCRIRTSEQSFVRKMVKVD
jgi:hypothetical protein